MVAPSSCGIAVPVDFAARPDCAYVRRYVGLINNLPVDFDLMNDPVPDAKEFRGNLLEISSLVKEAVFSVVLELATLELSLRPSQQCVPFLFGDKRSSDLEFCVLVQFHHINLLR